MLRDAARTFFANKGWVKKALLGTLIALIPYVGAMVVYGYGLEMNRRVAWATSDELPDWGPFTTYLKRGFFGFLVAMVYSLPASVITSLLIAPLSLIVAAGAGTGTNIGVFFGVFMVATVVVLLVATAVVVPFTYSGMVNYNLYDSLGKGFEFASVWARMKANRPRLVTATWWTIAITTAITLLIFVGMTPYYVFIATMISNPGASTDPAPALGLLAIQGVLALFYPLLMFGSFVVNQIVWIMWGRYAREAYALEQSPAQPGHALPGAGPAGTDGAAAAWLPEAPGA